MTTEGYTLGGHTSLFDPAYSSDFTTNLWKTCPLLEYIFDPTIGVLLHEKWDAFDATLMYTTTQATTGTSVLSAVDPNTLILDSDSTTDTQGANMQRVKGTPFTPAADKHIWAEFSIAVQELANAQFFVGLSEADTEIIDTNANASTNHIGWESVTEDSKIVFAAEKAGTRATPLTAATMVEDTDIKLGFYVDGITSVQQYINGVPTGDPHPTANVPVVAMYPSFVCQTTDTQDPIMLIREYKIFQLK